MGQPAQALGAEEIDQRTANRHLAADIHEDRANARDGMPVFPYAGGAINVLGVGEGGKVGEFEQHGESGKYRGETKVGNLHRGGPLHSGPGEDMEDQPAAKQRPDRRAEGIEGLGKVEAA